jgi:uncharacterized protein YcbK (DUF882 family)
LVPLSEHFTEQEFACHHCGSVGQGINTELLTKLEQLRDALGGRPIIITSGYRCKVYNKRVGGKTHSKHMEGLACDIRVPGKTPQQVAAAALELGFNGVGAYNIKRFTHVDVADRRWVDLEADAGAVKGK